MYCTYICREGGVPNSTLLYHVLVHVLVHVQHVVTVH